MNKNLQIVSSSNLPENLNAPVHSQTGEKNVQIAHADEVTVKQNNVYILPNNTSSFGLSVLPTGTPIEFNR